MEKTKSLKALTEVKQEKSEFKIDNEKLEISTIPFGVQNITLSKLKEKNKDIFGYLKFDSGLINEPLAQGSDNDFYLYHDVEKNYSVFGTVFMDYANKLEDSNINLYGHSSITPSVKFQPLNRMFREEELFQDNQYFSIYLENEVRRYKIAYMYHYGEFNEYDHRQRNFVNEKDFDNFKKYFMPRAKKYDELKYGDKFVSLQVCLDWNLDRRVIVIGKEVGRYEQKAN